ncbi:MAG TPA: type II toxin-antitoxin system RelE/ParE family toxin [Tepidisphaeraceae bacterium]|jgi:plasmid stabilization system protein ParE
MSLPIRLRPEVVSDLLQAADWYDQQQRGLGREFIEAAYTAFDLLADRPQSFPVVRKNVRRALMRRFPYAIYFRIESNVIVILVVVHTARSSRAWKRRAR